MQTIRLRVNEKTYKYLMWFLGKFSKDEVEIIEEDACFLAAQAELKSEFEKLEKGKSEFIDLQQLDEDLEKTIRKYEA
jgi:hypothetical protein